LALEHLERLKAELRNDLESVNANIAELEAGGAVKRNRVEELASVLFALASQEQYLAISDPEKASERHEENEMRKAQDKLREILVDVERESRAPSHEGKLADIYNSFRSRLMMTINAMDLVAVALRKNAELLQRRSTSSSKTQAAEGGTGTRVQPGSSAIIRSQELERHRIAREIHDGPAQAIANVVLRMDILAKISEKDPSRIREELARMKEIAQGALDEIRGFIFDLRPMTLQDLGLVATIKRVTSSLKELSGLNVRFVVDGDERPLGQLVTLTVFRIAQESITNLRKYSKCSTAWVHLKYLEGKVILIVEDDGAGFDLSEVANGQKRFATFGLLGMRERADDINADLEITSAPGRGTKVVLVVPTKDNPALDAKLD